MCGQRAARNIRLRQQQAFTDVAQILKRRIELMLALPESSLASLSIQSQLNAIGKL